MCVQYRGGCSVPWGDILSTVGDIMINVGGYLEYRGGCSLPWGDIMSTVGGYLEYRGGCSVPWGDIMMHVGDIMSTVEGVQYRGGIPSFELWVPWGDIMMHVGGYHEYRGGCSVPWGTQITIDFSPTVLNTLHGTHDIPPRASWYPPTVLNIPHGTQDNPTVLMISPHGTEHPPRYSRYPPHLSWYPHGTEHPHGTQDIPPRYSWYPPRYWTPPTVLHTHYTGCVLSSGLDFQGWIGYAGTHVPMFVHKMGLIKPRQT